MSPRSDAAILLIGNELLSGRVQDDNLSFLASELWRLGVPVQTARMVRDEPEAIAENLRPLIEGHTHVFTTGGIGPTHDDMTIDGVALAFGVPVIVDPRLESMIRAHLESRGEEVTAAHLRMARTPEGCELVPADASTWPTICFRETYILPGVPSILRRKFEALRPRFSGNPIHRKMVAFSTKETVLAPLLEEAAGAFPDVEIGSYPQSDRVVVTVEGSEESRISEALERVLAAAKNIPRAESDD